MMAPTYRTKIVLSSPGEAVTRRVHTWDAPELLSPLTVAAGLAGAVASAAMRVAAGMQRRRILLGLTP